MRLPFKTLDDVDVAGKRVMVRVDLNVPVRAGQVTDTTRIERIIPTIQELRDKKARVVVISHFGRPRGKFVREMSLRNVLRAFQGLLGGGQIAFADDCIGPPALLVSNRLKDGDVALFENIRYHGGEERNDPVFARSLAASAQLYVNDAFAAAHRTHASVCAITRFLPAYAGRLLETEVKTLTHVLEEPERPLTAIVGGAKVSTKLELLGNLLHKVDKLVIGGGMANTFLYASGLEIGRSLAENRMADTAREIMASAQAKGCEIVLPVDVVVAAELKRNAPSNTVPVTSVPQRGAILDIGPETVKEIEKRLTESRCVVWNGPLGAFETPPFDAGTVAVAQAMARVTKAGKLTSVAGGGDTVSALAKAGVMNDLTYVSTAGGAFLEWLEGKELPGIAALVGRT